MTDTILWQPKGSAVMHAIQPEILNLDTGKVLAFCGTWIVPLPAEQKTEPGVNACMQCLRAMKKLARS